MATEAEKALALRITGLINRVIRLSKTINTQADIISKASSEAYALDFLREKRDQINSDFEKAEGFHTELISISNEESRKDFAYFGEKYWEKLESRHIEVTQVLDERINLLYKSRDERTMLSTSTPHSSPHHSLSTPVNTNLRLPKLEITPFDGTYDHWQNFHDMFTATVHENTSLSPAMKLQHLKSVVQGEAADLLSAIRITDANYNIAWDTLKDRYQKESTLLLHHLHKIKALPNITQMSLKLLTQMRNTLKVSIDSIQLLVEDFGNGGHYLIVDMIDKFGGDLRLEWEKSRAGLNTFPKYEELTKFLDNQITILESLEGKSTKSTTSNPSKTKAAMNVTVRSGVTCGYCEESHSIFQCPAFLKLSVHDRQKARKAKKLCVNCLGRKHEVKDCRSQVRCRNCNKPHHTLLHYDTPPKSSQNQNKEQRKETIKSPADSNSDESKDEKIVHHVATMSAEVMLATAIVNVVAPSGQTLEVRALIDSGAEASFISETLIQLLRLPKRKTGVVINGLQGARSSSPKFTTTFEVMDNLTGSCRFWVDAYVLQCITAYRPKLFHPKQYSELQSLELADPDPSTGVRIDLLLGADTMGKFMQEGLLHLKDSQVIAQKTAFGWILSGPVELPQTPRSVTVQHATSELPDLLQRFWELEEARDSSTLTEDEELAERIFQETTTRDSTGRFTVRLPFVSEEAKQSLGNSFHIARAAWKRVAAGLDKKPGARKQYDEFMLEYIQQGHMEEIPIDETTMGYNYLPHHAVIRDDKRTTKVRVVYNASSTTRSGVSLNDVLCTGPKLQNEVTDVVSNWRNHEYVFAADITKMFRQIKVHEDDQPYQCIVWNEAGSSDIRAFKLLTVTYGTKPAPYLANRVIKAVVEAHGDEFPEAVETLSKCIYVDDVMGGANSKEKAIHKRKQIDDMLKKGGLELRKWASNCPDILPDASESTTEFFLEPEDESNKKVLGIAWSPQRDTFGFKVKPVDLEKVTKRTILSNIARIYDPLGWLAPIVIRAKVLMQSLWLSKAGWDDQDLSEEIIAEWHRFCNELPDISNVTLPRFIGPGNSPATVKLIGFSDASKRAYSATVYLCVEYQYGETKAHLLQAKSRVAPIKTQSIPRLELSGAVLLTNLIKKIQAAWLGRIDEIKCFTDSRIVLDWLAKHASSWHTFVANRVSHIQTELPAVQWQHVPSKSNPADLNSRGLSVKDLLESTLWWHGPNLASLETPQPSPEEQEEHLVEVAKEACQRVAAHHGFIPRPPDYLVRFSSWYKLLRVLAYWAKYFRILLQRVRNNPRPPGAPHELLEAHEFRTRLEVRKPGWTTYVLTRNDINRAQDHIHRILQEISFPSELAALRENLPVSKGSPLHQIDPILDLQGVMRVGGRLEEARLPYAQKHPVILGRGRVTNILIRSTHLECLHGGLQLTLSVLREQYWIVHARNQVKAVIYKCVPCAVQKATLETQQMCSLPESRINEAPPFSHVGLDYAGPFQMKHGTGRGHASHKIWVALFICFTTRAIHLEVVDSLSTPDFLAAFKAFVGRRGLPSDIYSDQAPTFKGANNELKRAFKALTEDPNLHSTLAAQNVQWHHIVPHGAFKGGLWEAGVKAFKFHFKRVLGKFTPSWAEMRTLLCQIEACLNSRPITPQRDVATEAPPLTSGHFLIGRSLKAVPEPSLLDKKEYLLTRWQTVTKMAQDFWKRWRNEYLQTLQRRNKWQNKMENLEVDDIVLIKDKNRQPCDWGIARVIEVKPSRDNLVREVRVDLQQPQDKKNRRREPKRTQLDRPIAELCKLPVHEDATRSD